MAEIKDKIVEVIFRAPERRNISLFYFGGSILFLGLYFFRKGDLFALTMFSGFVLTGLSESVPEEKNVLAGSLRIAAILVYTTVLVLSMVRPGLII